MTHILTFDLGGGGLRAALIGPEGETAAADAEPIPGFGGGETDPELWWRAAIRLADGLAAEAGAAFGTVRAVAATGFTRTQVLLDETGDPVRPAIGFADARADALLDEARAELPLDHPEAAQINAFHGAMRLFWLARHEREILARTTRVVEPKDFINARLTGRVVSDAISSARLAAAATGGGGSILAALKIDPALAPATLTPTEIVGQVRPNLPGALARLAGRPVLAMAHDTWAATLGLGALRPGYAYNIAGTTDVFGLICPAPAGAEGLLSVDWGPQAHQLGGPSLAGGDTVRWARETLGSGAPEDAVDALLAAPRRGGELLFLPYLRGERTPWWDPSLRGAFLGLDSAHGAADMFRAALEGVALLNRVVLDRAEAAAGRRAREIRFGGGGARSAEWARIKANACGRPVATMAAPEPGLLGCAIAARVGLVDWPDLASAQEALVHPARRFEPEPEEAARFDRLAPLFLSAHEALAPLSASLSTMRT